MVSKQKRFSHSKQADLVRRGFKKCSSCDQVLLLEDFYNNGSRADGKDQYCKSCRKGIQADYLDGKERARRKLLEMSGLV